MTKTSFISEQSGATMGNGNDFLRTDLIISGHILSRFNNCFSSAFDLIVPQLIYTFLVLYIETIQEGNLSVIFKKRVLIIWLKDAFKPDVCEALSRIAQKKATLERLNQYHLERQDKNRLGPALPCCLCTLVPLETWKLTAD